MMSTIQHNGMHNDKYNKYNEKHKVSNAIILAAGKSNRFKPVSDYCPKGLSLVKGEVLIERQIKQLQDVGITDITIVVGYKKEMFYYLRDAYNVTIIDNDLYDTQDNISSLRLVLDKLDNTYICSVDNYYPNNLFQTYESYGFYSTVYKSCNTDEWVVTVDGNGVINNVTIGAPKGYIMLGFVYFDRQFSTAFKQIIQDIEGIDQYNHHVWEYMYMQFIDRLKLHIKVFDEADILEFDSIDDVLAFDDVFMEHNTQTAVKVRQRV